MKVNDLHALVDLSPGGKGAECSADKETSSLFDQQILTRDSKDEVLT
jgi:hypothetical protein